MSGVNESQANTAPLVVVFADISGSTRLYDTLGDTQAKRLVTECLDLLARIAVAHGGEVVTTIGDEVMCCFAVPAEAAAAACEMHASLKEAVQSGSIRVDQIKLRIGMHRGLVLREKNDLLGEEVDIARHVAKVAKADETLITRQTVDALPPLYRSLTRAVCEEPWEGRADRIELHELVWEVDGLTVHAPAAGSQPQLAMVRVLLRYGGEEMVLDAANPLVTVGRGSQNDIVVNYDLVSRQHLQIAARAGRAVLIDNSTNGTLVADQNGEEAVVHRTMHTLSGKGAIYFGNPAETDRRHALYFTCE